MADYNSSLPVRTQGDAQEKLQSKLVDFTTPTQGAIIDTDGNLHIEVHGNDGAATDRVLKLSESGNVSLNGDYDAATNTNASSSAIVAHDRNAAPGVATQNKRPSAVVGNSDKTALDVALSDSSGNNITETNPLWVTVASSPGIEVADYDTSAAIAAAASDNHAYLIAGTDFELWQVEASASGKCKIEIKVGPVGTEVTKAVLFNSTASPNMSFKLEKPITVVVGDNVLVVRTNKDNQAQDVYSTIVGIHKA